MKLAKIIFVAIFYLMAGGFCFPIHAAENFNYAEIWNPITKQTEKTALLFNNTNGYNFSAIDLGSDGLSELVFGSEPGEKPRVKILRADGSKINEFLAYDENFTGGVNVAGCNFDNDKKSEILTAPISAGSAHIRIFDGYGKPIINSGFFAWPEKIRSGASIGCADITGDGKDEIVATSGAYNQFKEIKIFDASGKLLKQSKISLRGKRIKISHVDLGGDGIDEILVAGSWQDKPIIKILRGDLSLIGEFIAYDENFTGGVNVVGVDIDADGKGEIITTPQVLGGPHLKIFDGFGHEKITSNTFVFGSSFLGGLSLAVGNFNDDKNLELYLAPAHLPIGRTDFQKYIDINVKEQKFRYYENGFLLGEFLTSTGKPSTPTRFGEFTAFSKYDMAYGGADGQKWGMPYFIGFYKSGGVVNGIHELPFLDGRREGTASLGRAVSHGCVRLDIGPAKEIYDWVEINKTRVLVHK